MKNKFFQIFFTSFFIFIFLSSNVFGPVLGNLFAVRQMAYAGPLDAVTAIDPQDVTSHNHAIRLIQDHLSMLSGMSANQETYNSVPFKNVVSAYMYIFKDILVAMKVNDSVQLNEIFKLLKKNNLPINIEIFEGPHAMQLIHANRLAAQTDTPDRITRLADNIRTVMRISIPVSALAGLTSIFVMVKSDNTFFPMAMLASGIVFATSILSEVGHVIFGDSLVWDYFNLNTQTHILNDIERQAYQMAAIATTSHVAAPYVPLAPKPKFLCWNFFRKK